MNTRLIMLSSAIFLAAIGIIFTFLPSEIANFMKINSVAVSLLFQLLGALFFAFAMLNWMAKGAIIGGIYNRPISIANFTHFFIGALALIKVCFNNHSLPWAVWVLAGIYSVFAVLFGLIFNRHPDAGKTA